MVTLRAFQLLLFSFAVFETQQITVNAFSITRGGTFSHTNRWASPVTVSATRKEVSEVAVDVSTPPRTPVQRHYDTYIWKHNNNEYKINYRVEGPENASPMLLIHGFGANLNHFRYNIPDLSKKYRVYAIDLLGFGASDKPSEEYSIGLFANLAQDFMSNMSDKPWVVAGNSIGGLTALSVAKDNAEKVSAVILFNCSGGMSIFRYSDVPFFARPILWFFQKVILGPAIGGRYFENFSSRQNVEQILKKSGIYGDLTNVDEDLLEILLAPADDPGAQDVFLRVFAGDAGPTPYSILPSVKAPILALWGGSDPWTPVDNGFYPGNTFADYNDHFELQILEGAGHCPHDECPKECNTRVLSWLEKQQL